MPWKCHLCNIAHDELPGCFGMDAPWAVFVPESEFDSRVELTQDQCVVDEEHFFIRGHIDIPIHGQDEPLSFSVWSSLSEESYLRMSDRWEEPDALEAGQKIVTHLADVGQGLAGVFHPVFYRGAGEPEGGGIDVEQSAQA
jgi:hypothetical protein